MTLRGIGRVLECRPIYSGRISNNSSTRIWAQRPSHLYHKYPGPSPIWTRGAKTKTVIKADSLPQGALPPLPPNEEDVPVKQYPTVLQQHLNNVRKFHDCVVLTRVGDFYEMYFDQVDEFAHLVNLKKAKRATALGDVAMAGFQYAQLDRYLKMFVQDLGKKVAISEQVRLSESERTARSGGPMYDRKVTRVITAGTLIDETFMDPFENNYLLAVHLEELPPMLDQSSKHEALERQKRDIKVGLSWLDLSSGSFFTQSGDLSSLPSMVARVGPREVVLDSSMESVDEAQLQHLLGDGEFSLHYHPISEPTSSVDEWTPMLERAIPADQQPAFTPPEISAGSLVLDYVRNKIIDTKIQLQPPVRRSDDEYMTIDKQSLRGLEIRNTLRDHAFQGSLLHAVRHTVTKSGARLLSQRLVSPSMSLSVINNRLDLVQEFIYYDALREDIVALLRRTADIVRLVQKFSIGRGDADELLALSKTIEVMKQTRDLLRDHMQTVRSQPDESSESKELAFLQDIIDRLDLDGPTKVAKSIQSAIDEDSLSRRHAVEDEAQAQVEEMSQEVVAADSAGEKIPKLARRATRSKATKEIDLGPDEIWIMRQNSSPTLERAHEKLASLMSEKKDLTQTLRTELQSESLTLKWSAQLGHYCHLKGRDAKGTLAALEGARSIGSTKSTRTFHLTPWTRLGVQIDDSKLRIRSEEDRVFSKLRAQVIENLMKLRRNAAILDELDVAISSATTAKTRNLVRPILHTGTSHKIIAGRHPTVDIGLQDQGRPFTSNDCSVNDGGTERIYLITGPNMAGKSTYLRQNALITILAQTGCYVPASYAEIGLVDKIFSRIGSADNLYQDQSTFMVEMLETAAILKAATPRSFVIMDEVGRGTTPEDGVAVGYACLHHLHYVNQCRALFATHFHGLADLTRGFEGLACYCTDVAEEADGSWAYVHRLKRGINRQSHALKVARLAGLPSSAIAVAAGVLEDLERARSGEQGGEKAAASTS